MPEQEYTEGEILGWIIHRADGTVDEGVGPPVSFQTGDQVSVKTRFTVELT